MQDNGLKQMQSAEIDILQQVIRICDKHGLLYFVVGGTLLGAIRHGGFIPWDDDIDISMPRPDYEKFIEIAEQELQSPYQMNTIRLMQNGFCYYYARAESSRVMLERYETRMKKCVPIWIDVFPLDGVPEDKKTLKRWMKKGAFWHKLLELSQYSFLAFEKRGKTSLKTVLQDVAYKLKLDRFISTQWAWNNLDKVVKKYDYQSSKKVTNFCGRYGYKEIVDKSVFGEGTFVSFEKIKVRAPSNYDDYLRHIYGDYMKLPPESERIRHFVKIL